MQLNSQTIITSGITGFSGLKCHQDSALIYIDSVFPYAGLISTF